MPSESERVRGGRQAPAAAASRPASPLGALQLFGLTLNRVRKPATIGVALAGRRYQGAGAMKDAPSISTPLSDADFDAIADVLDEDSSFDTDGVLGHMHAVVVAPSMMPPSSWLQLVFPAALPDPRAVHREHGPRVVISERLREDLKNGRRYYPYDHERLLHLPSDPKLRPSRDALAWHLEHVFERVE